MREKIFDRLLTIKSIVTLLLTVVFCALAVKGVISAENFMTVYTVVIAFYFANQMRKVIDKKEG